jgi:cation:H+ antiporter
LKSELPWLLAATVLAIVLLFDLYLSPLDGVILLSSLALILYRLTTNQKRHPDVIVESIQDELDELPSMNNKQAIMWLVIGIVILLLSAELLVWAATKIAVGLGVSDLIIGLTVVAVGTSLPELAATLGAAVKGHSDIAIGNIVGSNMLNILAVLAVPALVHPTALDTALVWRDSGMMLALTLLLILFAFGLHSRPVITRFEGIVMVLAWLGYMTMLAMGG